jgi:di/tricarboxylate transporter
VGKPLSELAVLEQLNARLLAIRRRAEVLHDRIENVPLASGDTLLVQVPSGAWKDSESTHDFLLLKSDQPKQYRYDKIPVAVAILVGVVIAASIGLAPIVISALAGVVLMGLFGVLRPQELYESVRWDIIFLLAGVIPLGMALEESGAASLLGHAVAEVATVLPALGVLWVLYMITSLVTAFISNNASVLLLLPVAFETAVEIGAEPFSFILAVTFAASAAFISPLGYQTNLFVYGPGGYKVTDYVRLGLPLQLVCSVVTVLGIWMIWGV